MKVLCKRDELARGLRLAATAVTDCPKPILRNVKLEAAGDAVALLAGNLSVWIRTKLSADDVTVVSPGDALLPAKQVAAFLQAATGDRVTIIADAAGVAVKSDRCAARFSTEPPGEFPTPDLSRGNAACGLSAQFLREAIHRTGFAVSNSDTGRFALNGLHLEMEGPSVDVVGTDCHRMAWQHGTVTETGGSPESLRSATISGDALRVLSRVLREQEAGIVHVATDGDATVVSNQQSTLLCQSVGGRFPKWRDIISPSVAKQGPRLDLVAGPFCVAVQQAVIAGTRDSREIVIVCRPGMLTMTAQTEAGESKAEVPIDYEGPETAVVLKADFLVEYLKAVSPETAVRLELGNGNGPVVCRTDDGYVYSISAYDKSQCKSQLAAAGVK
jgi:DNA polymerase-3 subunit beta